MFYGILMKDMEVVIAYQLTPKSRVILEKVVTCSQEIPLSFRETKGTLPCSQEPFTGSKT